jgi:hypothetical protein
MLHSVIVYAPCLFVCLLVAPIGWPCCHLSLSVWTISAVICQWSYELFIWKSISGLDPKQHVLSYYVAMIISEGSLICSCEWLLHISNNYCIYVDACAVVYKCLSTTLVCICIITTNMWVYENSDVSKWTADFNIICHTYSYGNNVK